MKLFNDDCLKVLPIIPDKSIDLILTDPPYGTTACKWDSIIPLDKMWFELKRIRKDNSAIVFTASQPFTTILINSNFNEFRYDLVWCKNQGTNFYYANRMPLRSHEDVLLFYKKLPKYNPQETDGEPYQQKRGTASDVYSGKD
jgi:site-specific DNA-methyltransferase (adenine-specific)